MNPGQPAIHRMFVGDRVVFARTGRVVGRDERGLRLWIPNGGAAVVDMAADGRGIRDMPFAEWVVQPKVQTPVPWRGPDLLMLVPPNAGHSVYWFWDAATRDFAAWYVNLEEPAVRWDDGDLAGVDTVDHDLDIWVYPDRTWEWKDEDELAERLGFPEHYWVTDERAVWAEGERVVPLIEAGKFPFDGTWCDFRPDPAWTPLPELPAGWDRPRHRAGGGAGH